MIFKMMIDPPRTTAQEKGVRVVHGRPFFYTKKAVKDAERVYMDELLKHRPERPLNGPITLVTIWEYKRGKHKHGEYKTTKPDTDNMVKLLKDCMTRAGFWTDDSQVAAETTLKIWSDEPGIGVYVEEIK